MNGRRLLPLVLPVAPDLEERLARVLIRGEHDGVADLLIGVLPPWCDGPSAANNLTHLWPSSIAWPSAMLRDAVGKAAAEASEDTVEHVHEMIFAELPLLEAGPSRDHLETILLDSMLARAWLSPEKRGGDLGQLAAAVALSTRYDPDELIRCMVTAIAWSAASVVSDRRFVLADPSLSLLDRGRHTELARVSRCAQAIMRVLGLAAAARALGKKPRMAPSRGVRLTGAAALLARIHSSDVGEVFQDWRATALTRPEGREDFASFHSCLASLRDLADDQQLSLRRLKVAAQQIPFSGHTFELSMEFQGAASLWAGLAGDRDGAHAAAQAAIAAGLRYGVPPDEAVTFFASAAGLLQIAAARGPVRLHGEASQLLPELRDILRGGAIGLIRSAHARLVDAIRAATWVAPSPFGLTIEDIWDRAAAVPRDRRVRIRSRTETGETGPALKDTLVVVPQLPEQRGSAGRDVERDWRNLVGKPLPLVTRPDLRHASLTLKGELPHLGSVIDRIMRISRVERRWSSRQPCWWVRLGLGKRTSLGVSRRHLGFPSSYTLRELSQMDR